MLNSVFSPVATLPVLLLAFGCAMALGVLNALVFGFKSRLSASFAITLALLPLVVSLIIFLVNGNIGTGVAVAGTFALVRFRSAPGSAREISAIFAAMAQGLCLGMGYIGLAVLFFALAAAFVLVLTAVNFGGSSGEQKQLKISLPENIDYDGLFDEVFARYTKGAELRKVRTTNMGTLFELTYLVTLPGGKIPKAFLDELRTRNGNLSIAVGAVAEEATVAL